MIYKRKRNNKIFNNKIFNNKIFNYNNKNNEMIGLDI
jgi:hypothetical protein